MPFRTVLVSGRQVPVIEEPDGFVVLRGHLGVAGPFTHDDPRFSLSDSGHDPLIAASVARARSIPALDDRMKTLPTI